MSRKGATFEEFKRYTLAVVRGERNVEAGDPRIWCEPADDGHPSGVAPGTLENSHYLHSVLRERIVEHVFVGDVLRLLWQRGAVDVEVLRSEFDAGGYDLVMSYRNIIRHIQFKSTTDGGKAARVNVSLKLMNKPSGCVIWLIVTPKELEIKSYRWFGAAPGEPLPNIEELRFAKKTKGNAQGIKDPKPGHRVVPIGRFEELSSMDAVLEKLFGSVP